MLIAFVPFCVASFSHFLDFKLFAKTIIAFSVVNKKNDFFGQATQEVSFLCSAPRFYLLANQEAVAHVHLSRISCPCLHRNEPRNHRCPFWLIWLNI